MIPSLHAGIDNSTKYQGSGSNAFAYQVHVTTLSPHHQVLPIITPATDKVNLSFEVSRNEGVHEGEQTVAPTSSPSSHMPSSSSLSSSLPNQPVTSQKLFREQTDVMAALQRDQVLLGLIAMRDQPKDEVKEVVEQCLNGGVRFVYFSQDDERRTHALGLKIGVFTGFNDLVSLRDPLNKQDLKEKYSSISKLPRGIHAIRQHLRDVDNVPLLVSLFSDCTPETEAEMIRIYQENGEVVFCVGSSLQWQNMEVYMQADVSASLDPNSAEICLHDRYNVAAAAVEKRKKEMEAEAQKEAAEMAKDDMKFNGEDGVGSKVIESENGTGNVMPHGSTGRSVGGQGFQGSAFDGTAIVMETNGGLAASSSLSSSSSVEKFAPALEPSPTLSGANATHPPPFSSSSSQPGLDNRGSEFDLNSFLHSVGPTVIYCAPLLKRHGFDHPSTLTVMNKQHCTEIGVPLGVTQLLINKIEVMNASTSNETSAGNVWDGNGSPWAVFYKSRNGMDEQTGGADTTQVPLAGADNSAVEVNKKNKKDKTSAGLLAYSESFEFSASAMITSSPCVLPLCANTDLNQFTALIVVGRQLISNVSQCFFFAFSAYLSLCLACFATAALGMPPLLTGYQLLYVIWYGFSSTYFSCRIIFFV